jgi:hypothetical protein
MTAAPGWALDQADPWMHPHLERLYWLWDCANSRWFDGQLSTPLIEVALPSANSRGSHAWADIGPTTEHGATLAVRIHPGMLRDRDPDWHRPADRDLLHEATHGWQVEVLGWDWDEGNDWHGATFLAQLAEVQRAYDLDRTMLPRLP